MLSAIRSGKLKYDEGEKRCEICAAPLPPLECWPDRKHFLCERPECRAASNRRIYDSTHLTQRVQDGERRCDGPGCGKPVGGGLFPKRKGLFFCSDKCRAERGRQRARPNCRCAYCGMEMYRRPGALYEQNFCTPSHLAKYRSEEVTAKKAGRFLGVLKEYLGGYAKAHYKSTGLPTVKWEVLRFLEFLNAKRVRSLNSVTPKTISEYFVWGLEDGRKAAPHMGFVSRFMEWLRLEGRRNTANPVLRGFFSRRSGRNPRPYTEEEIKEIWQILEERGDTLAKLAVAIGEESGLRIGEVANLRLADVDLDAQQVFVRLPNKGDRERWVPFHEKTKKYLTLWLKERDPNCGHDHLLHNTRGRPATVPRLQVRLKSILLRQSQYRINPWGLESFSFHRLRHFMASSLSNHGADAGTVMAVGGWASARSMEAYVKIKPETVKRSYDEAMKQMEGGERQPTKRVLTLEEFAGTVGKDSEKAGN